MVAVTICPGSLCKPGAPRLRPHRLGRALPARRPSRGLHCGPPGLRLPARRAGARQIHGASLDLRAGCVHTALLFVGISGLLTPFSAAQCDIEGGLRCNKAECAQQKRCCMYIAKKQCMSESVAMKQLQTWTSLLYCNKAQSAHSAVGPKRTSWQVLNSDGAAIEAPADPCPAMTRVHPNISPGGVVVGFRWRLQRILVYHSAAARAIILLLQGRTVCTTAARPPCSSERRTFPTTSG